MSKQALAQHAVSEVRDKKDVYSKVLLMYLAPKKKKKVHSYNGIKTHEKYKHSESYKTKSSNLITKCQQNTIPMH